MTGFTVAGPGPGQFNSIDDGIFVFGGATATIFGCTVRDVRDDPLSGIQTGVGIQVGCASLGQVGHAALSNDAVLGSQKGNIVIDGPGSTATVDSCTVTGVGPTPVIAENGVQVSRGAVATITNCVISGHSYTGIYGGPDPLADTQSCGILFYQAGAGSGASGNVVTQNDIGIYAQGDGPLTLAGNTVTNNPDEGIFVDQGATALTANFVGGSRIGVCVASFGGNTADSVATVTSNTITGNGTGIALLNDTPGNPTQPQLVAHFNVIEGNAGGGVVNMTPGKADATLNWWGRDTGPNHASSGPGDPATDTTSGADVSTWLVLTLTAANTNLHQGESTTVTADLRHDSTGAVHTEAFVPDGMAVHFAAVSGSVQPTEATTSQGQATTTYTAPSGFETDTASAQVDNQTVSQSLNVCLRNACWTNVTGDQSWNDPLNWDFGYLGSGVHGLPEPCDDVFVFASAPGSLVVHDTGVATIHSLHDQKFLNFSGGSLSMATDSDIAGYFRFNGALEQVAGTLTLTGGGEGSGRFTIDGGAVVAMENGTYVAHAGTAFFGAGLLQIGAAAAPDPLVIKAVMKFQNNVSIPNLTLGAKGELTGPGIVTISDEITWTGGTISSTGEVRIDSNAMMAISGAATKTLDGATIRVRDRGALEWFEGTIDVLKRGGNFIIQSGGQMELQADVKMTASQGVVPRIRNSGILAKCCGNDIAQLQANVDNVGGNIRVDGGTLSLYSLTLEDGAVEGAGNLKVTHDFTWDRGRMIGEGTTALAPGSSIDLTAVGTLLTRQLLRKLDSSANGTMAGQLSIGGEGSFSNSGELTALRGTVVLFFPFGVPDVTFENKGTLLVDRGGPVTFDVVFNNDGAVFVDRSAGLLLRQGGVETGTFSVGAEGTVTLGGTEAEYTFAPLLRGTNQHMLLGAGTYIINAENKLIVPLGNEVYASNVDLKDKGIIQGEGSLHVTGVLDWMSGSMQEGGTTQIDQGGTLKINSAVAHPLIARTLLNYGEVDWNGRGGIVLSKGAQIINDGKFGAGVFVASGGGSISRDANDRSIVQFIVRNFGDFEVTSDKVTTTVAIPLRNEGGVVQLVGKGIELDLTMSYTQTGGLTLVGAGNTFKDKFGVRDEGGLLDLDGGLLVAPTGLSIPRGAFLAGPGEITGNVFNAGTILVGGTTNATGTLKINGNFHQFASGTLVFQVNGAKAKQFDQLVLSVNVPNIFATLAGSLVVVVNFKPQPGNTANLVDAEIQGTFDSVFVTPAGIGYQIIYRPNFGVFIRF